MICTNRSGEKALLLARKIPTVSQNKATAAKTPDGGVGGWDGAHATRASPEKRGELRQGLWGGRGLQGLKLCHIFVLFNFFCREGVGLQILCSKQRVPFDSSYSIRIEPLKCIHHTCCTKSHFICLRIQTVNSQGKNVF